MFYEQDYVNPKTAIQRAFTKSVIRCQLLNSIYSVARDHHRKASSSLIQMGLYFFNIHKAGVGVMLKDNKGDAIIASSILETKAPNPESFESLAILKCLQLYMHLGISNLIIESNCQVVVNELQHLKLCVLYWVIFCKISNL